MKGISCTRAMLVMAALLAAAGATAATKAEREESMSADGLLKTKAKGIDLVYARPGASLASYSSVKLEPVKVAFRKDFDPKKPGSQMRLSASELEKIRSDVGRIVSDAFTKELAKGSYPTVVASGPEVLQVQVDIVDLYVNAPDTMSAGRSRSYTMSAGEMTLVMELADSATGQVLARVYDRREARDVGQLTWTNSVTNQAEAANVASSWARILRARLDAARGIGGK